MKLRFTFKNPDAVHETIREAVQREMPDVDQDIRDERFDELYSVASQWFRYGEYVTVEVDTDTGTATVCRPS